MPRCPHAGAVDAATAGVLEDAVYHDVEVLRPLIHEVIAEDDLAETRAMRLDAGIALVLLDGGGAAEDQATRAVLQHCRTDLAQAGIDGDRFFRDTGLDEGAGHAVWGPGFLWTGLEDESDL